MIAPKDPQDNLTLEDAVDQFILTATHMFSSEEATELIIPLLRNPPTFPEEAIEEILALNPWLIENYETFNYIPKNIFFQNADFLISPTEEEIRDGILIPGHRFMPFLSHEVLPAHATLICANGNKVDRLNIERHRNDLFIYFTFFGFENMNRYFLTDHDENCAIMEASPHDNPMVKLTVFDMAALYAEHNVTPGDAFRLTVKNWKQGHYTLSFVSKMDLASQQHECSKWCKTFEKNLQEVINWCGPHTDVNDQFATALLTSDFPKTKAPIHLGGFYGQCKHIELQQTPDGVILWHQGESVRDAYLDSIENTPASATGRRDSLDAILSDIGLSLNENEITAYMLDALSCGHTDSNVVMKRCFAGRDATYFTDENQADIFNDLFITLWEKLSANYNPKRDKVYAPVRSRILAILDAQLGWLRDCDKKGLLPSELPQEPMMELAHACAILSSTLGLLTDGSTKASEIKELSKILQPMEQRCKELLNELCNEPSEPSTASNKRNTPTRHKLRVIEGGKSTNKNEVAAFQLRIDLKGIRPPIWRRLLVLSTTTLDELHHIIQAAMGWTNSHLHEFECDGERYSIPMDDDFDFDSEDETGVPLQQLICKEGDKLNYTYDFGDGWEHSVKLEKILPIEDGATYPRCIKGKRACPPEDCGGPWGYETMLKALEDPKNPDHAMFTDWIGDSFDSNGFDLEFTNYRIKMPKDLPF